jgi:hypothetical protein
MTFFSKQLWSMKNIISHIVVHKSTNRCQSFSPMRSALEKLETS